MKARIEKVVSQLPATLEKNTVYYVRVANGFDIYVTNNAGMVTSYPANYAAKNHSHSYIENTNYDQLADLNTYLEAGKMKYQPAVLQGSPNLFPSTNNANGILSLSTWKDNAYGHDFGFSSNGSIYHRYKSNHTQYGWNKMLTDAGPDGVVVNRGNVFKDNSDANNFPAFSEVISIELPNGSGNVNFPFNDYGTFTRIRSNSFITDLVHQNEGELYHRNWYAFGTPKSFRKIWDNVNFNPGNYWAKSELPDYRNYGLGVTQSPMVSDLNQFNYTSFYAITPTTFSKPFDYGTVLNQMYVGGEYTQLAIDTTTGKLQTRAKNNNNGFTLWQKYITDGIEVDKGYGIANGSTTRRNKVWFDYNWANSGHAGSVINFSGFEASNYPVEIFAEYFSDKIGFRTYNGDGNLGWSLPRWLWHSDNFNPANYLAIANTTKFIFGDNATGTSNAYPPDFGQPVNTFNPVKSGFYRPNDDNGYKALLIWVNHPGYSNGAYGAGLAFDYAGGEVFLTGKDGSGVKLTPKKIWHSNNLNPDNYLTKIDAGNQYVTLTTLQTINGKKTFNGADGNGYTGASIMLNGNGAANTIFPTLAFHQPTLYAATLSYRGNSGFFFKDISGDGAVNVTANGFLKAGSDDNFLLSGGGGHYNKSDFQPAGSYIKNGGQNTTSNNIFLGWTGNELQLTVDATTIGNLWTSNNFNPDLKLNRSGGIMTGSLDLKSGLILSDSTVPQIWSIYQTSAGINFYVTGGGNQGDVVKINQTGNIWTAVNGDSGQWNQAYLWGNHASAGYATQNWVSTNFAAKNHNHPEYQLAGNYVTQSVLDSQLGGYATETWVNNNFATETWVSNNFATMGWVSNNFLAASSLTKEVTLENSEVRLTPFDLIVYSNFNMFDTDNRLVYITLSDGGDIVMKNIFRFQNITIMNTSSKFGVFKVENTNIAIEIESHTTMNAYVNGDGRLINISAGTAQLF